MGNPKYNKEEGSFEEMAEKLEESSTVAPRGTNNVPKEEVKTDETTE